ncbi:Nitrogen permease regulator 2 [Hypocenomyce scalaris]|nr:Nitrogen permease regulator 2 [Hypocenomyce scalaris]
MEEGDTQSIPDEDVRRIMADSMAVGGGTGATDRDDATMGTDGNNNDDKEDDEDDVTVIPPRPRPKVVHQVPTDSIVPSTLASSSQPPLFHFPSISPYIIPRQELCDRPITITASSYRILGHPVRLASPKYDRNEYIFNFSLVLDATADTTSYLSVVLKLASLFRSLEEQSEFLSRDPSAPNTGKVYALCEILLEDLNNYCECMIPIDESNTLNIKLFPTYPPPPPISPHHVPLSTVRLESLTDSNWDLTMLLILPYLNGLNSVRQIALLADADYKLVRKAIAHLLYYGCVILLDIFSFGAIYAPTAEMAGFVQDADMQDECARYVAIPDSGLPGTGGNAALGGEHGQGSSAGIRLVELYCSLKQGQSLKSWCIEHAGALAGLDVRRLITFGVIKGFLYRVHKYAIATSLLAVGGGKQREQKTKEPPDAGLAKYLDGTHCFDEICTELLISEKELVGRLKGFGDVQIIHR